MNSIKVFYKLFLVLIVLLACSNYSHAATPAGYSEYFIPGDENIMGQVWADIGAAGGVALTAPRHTIISVVAWSPNTTIYYDHWENGYNFDPNNPDTTYDEKYVLANAGDSKLFESSNIPVNPRGVATYYDGRDRIYVAGGVVTVTRTSWEETDGTVFSLAWEVYPVKPQMIKYIMPFGDDLASAPRNYIDFLRVFALIQATKNNAIVTFDVNKDGVFGDTICISHNNPCTTTATQVTLNEGEVFLLDRFAPFPTTGTVSLQTGTVIQGSDTLQVNYIVGDQTATYEARGFSAFPSGMWDNEYYAPVPTDVGANYPTQLYVYNPQSTALTINYQTSATSGSFSIPAGQTRSFFEMTGGYVPQGSGVYLTASDVFWGVSTIDTGYLPYPPARGQTTEWGYPLVPSFLLGNEHFFGWAPGAYVVPPPILPANYDDSGIFITPAQDNTRVFVDRNNDGIVDYTYTLNRLQSQYVYDATDGDMSNSHVWATGPISIAYGQNPDTSLTGAPSIDLGYVSFPGGDFIDKVLTVTKTADPVVVATTAGATSIYTLTVDSHNFSVDSISVVDTLPANWQFVNNSAVITLADMTTLSGASANPTIAGQVLTWPSSLLESMAENQTITITFTGQTTAGFAVGDITRNVVQASGTRTVAGAIQTFVTSDFAFNSYGDITVTKTSSATDPLYPGNQFTYTVTVTNPASATTNQTGVSIYDPLPNGVSYVAASGSVTCERLLNVRDEFATVAYTNNGPNNTANWAGAWAETDSLGGGAASGLVLVTGNQLRLGQSENVRDEFAAVAYTNNGPNNSANWAGNWTETDPGPGAAGAAGGFVWIFGGQLQFRYLLSNVADDFSTNASYTDNDGSNNWNAAWTETNDNPNGSAATGFIVVTGGVARFRGGGTAPANRSISRTATVTGATSAIINFTLTDNGIDAGETMVAEYQIDALGWQTIGTLDGGAGWTWGPGGAVPLTIPLTGNNTITIRFRAPQVWSSTTNDEAQVDNVNISFNAPANAVGSQIKRTANLTGATSATLNFSYSSANLVAGDTLVIEASNNAGGPFTTLATFTSGTPSVAPPYNLTAYISATTTIQFRVTGGFNATNKTFNVDNVDITYQRTPSAIQRTADLTGAVNPVLNFSYTAANLEAGDTLVVEAGAAAGGPFTTLATFAGGTPSVAPPYDLTPYISANTTIRFRITGGYDVTNETLSFDNVDISYYLPSTFASGNPPEFLSSGGCRIQPGNSLTLTFDVIVDNPLGTGIDHITNTALINSNEIILPISASVTNLVVNPSSQSAEVGDFVWFDTDGDGIQDVGEPGLSNVEVTLKDWLGASIATTTTNNGHFLFTNIEPGNGYYIEVTAGTIPPGLQQSAPAGHSDNRTNAFTLTAGQSYLSADLGYRTAPGTAAIGDFVWSDPNSNSLQDPGEPGLSGVTVQLWKDIDSNGLLDTGTDTLCTIALCGTNGTTITAPNGYYLFAGVTASGTEDYLVFIDGTQAALTGYTITSPTRVITDLSSGDTVLSADFGCQGTTYTISDKLWFDVDADGVLDGGETGISLVTVDLLDSSMNVIATTVTDASGNYTFTGVAGGSADYYIRISDTNGKLNDYYGTTASAIAGEKQIINLTGNLDYTAAPNFGYGLNQTIGSTIFNDVDGDGVLDSGELGISGVTVKLYSDAGTIGIIDGGDAVIATLTTDANGIYLFTGLSDGNYIVSIETPPAGYNYTGADSDSGTTGHQQAANITGGSSILTKNFGYTPPVPRSVSGSIWKDTDGDGIIDASETGLGNVTIDLMQGVSVIFSTTSAANGTYSFNNLVSGTYTVKITDTNGVLSGLTTTYEKTEGTTSPFNSQETVDLSGGNQTGINFGYNNPTPTLVILSDFRAYNDNSRVRVEWTTSSEIDTAGFFLFRLDESTGRYRQINRNLLPALLNSHQGGDYSLIDNGASLEKGNTYVLVEIEGKGAKNSYGPFTVIAGGSNAVESRYTSSAKAAGTFLSSFDRSAELQSRKITRYVDKEGTTVITNSGGKSSRGAENSVADEVSDYKRTLKAVSAEKEMRLSLGKKTMAQGRFLKTQRHGAMVKIAIEKDGLYYISSPELSRLNGMSQDEVKQLIKTAGLALSNQGSEAAYLPSEDYSGLYFYGQGTDSIYTKENIYWLSKGRGTRMGYTTDVGPAPVEDLTFTDTVHAEEDRLLAAYPFMDPEADFWFWDQIVGGWPGYDTKTFKIDTMGAAVTTSTATLTVNLQGYTETPADPDHHVRVSVNGTVLDNDDWWNGTEKRSSSFEFSQSLLHSGPNTIEVKGLLDTGAPWSLFYINSFDLTYHRLYEAVDNALLLKGEANPTVTVYGFTGPDILVFDVTNPLRPVLKTATTVEPYDGKYSASFVPSSPESVYLAITAGAAAKITDAWADSPSHLMNRNNQADYILIAPEELIAGAQELANYRQKKRLRTMVVNVEDIMDEFNYGLSSPKAIQAFLTYAYNNWSRPPKYVVLVGDGTYDYRDNLPYSLDLVPTMVVKTPDGLFTSDNVLADVNADHVPEMAIGRLPVISPEELHNVTAKIIAYERNAGNRILMLADNPDNGGNFPSDSDDLAALIPSKYQVKKIYLSDYLITDDARKMLFSEISSGTSLINYMGHASSDNLAAENLLVKSDVGPLSNSSNPFVLSAMTCMVGQYAYPGADADSLSETLLLKKDGGAAAVWAPSGLAFNSDSKLLAEYFIRTALKKRGMFLGSAILNSLRNFYSQGGPSYVLDIYNLQGDPALKLW